METRMDFGMVPLTEAEQMQIQGGGWGTVLGWLGAALTAGFEAGRWIGCALECVFGDG